jgi:FkbM family methyltransferase
VLLKAVKIHPEPKWIQRLAYTGIFKVTIDEEHFFNMKGSGLALEDKIFWNGLFKHEPFTLKTFIHQLEGTKWMADIGSNSGLFALMAASLRPDIKVFAVEPFPLFFNLLQKNIKINDYNIIPLQHALSNHTGVARFFAPPKFGGNPYSASLSLTHYYHHQDTEPETIEVPVSRFDDFLALQDILGKGLIKIDAEGHGVEVLEGMKETLQKYKPAVVIEVQSHAEAERVKLLLAGYTFFGIMDKKEKLTEKLTLPYHEDCNNYLCLHP